VHSTNTPATFITIAPDSAATRGTTPPVREPPSLAARCHALIAAAPYALTSDDVTTHRLLLGDARQLQGVETASVQLIVTSPPYPMVQMWDEVFRALSPASGEALDAGQGHGLL
jgi:hypothetical protein